MEASAVGIQYIDGRVEYITVLYGVSPDVLSKALNTRAKVIEFIKLGSRNSLEEEEELDLLPEEYSEANVVNTFTTFFSLTNFKYYYLFTSDDSWVFQTDSLRTTLRTTLRNTLRNTLCCNLH